MVFVGNSLVVSDNPDQDWNTPIEFLFSHLKTTLAMNGWKMNFKNQRTNVTLLLNGQRKPHSQLLILKNLLNQHN